MKTELFLSNNLASYFFFSENDLNDNSVIVDTAVIFFPGLPNPIEKEFFAAHMRDGVAFFSFNFFGTWLSGGKFSPKSARDSIGAAVDFCKKGDGITSFDGQELRWSFKRLIIAGYSFAANPILTSTITTADIDLVLLYAPLLFIHKDDLVSGSDEKLAKNLLEQNNHFLGFLRRGFVNALKGINDESWDIYFSGMDNESKVSLKSNFPNIKIFHGQKDRQITPIFSSSFGEIYKEKSDIFLIEDLGHTKELFSSTHLKF